MPALASSARRSRAILALTAIGVALAACTTPAPARKPVASCETWAAEGSRAIQGAPAPERYARALDEIGKGCEAVLPALRGGARTAARRSTRRERNDLLDAATRRLLPQACHPWSPSSPALDVVGRCPLEPDLGLARRAIAEMAGAEYAFLKALQKNLQDAGIYTENTEQLLRDFALSVALAAEREP